MVMMESLLKTWSQSFKLEEGRRTPKGWHIERVKFWEFKKEVRCIAQFAVWQKWLHEPGSLQSQGQNLGGRAGNQGANGMLAWQKGSWSRLGCIFPRTPHPMTNLDSWEGLLADKAAERQVGEFGSITHMADGEDHTHNKGVTYISRFGEDIREEKVGGGGKF